jgi:hypothetical protein
MSNTLTNENSAAQAKAVMEAVVAFEKALGSAVSAATTGNPDYLRAAISASGGGLENPKS